VTPGMCRTSVLPSEARTESEGSAPLKYGGSPQPIGWRPSRWTSV